MDGHFFQLLVAIITRFKQLLVNLQRLGDTNLRNQLEKVETLSGEVIEAVIAEFLKDVESGNWALVRWPQNFTDYSVSKLAVNAYTRLMAKQLAYRPDGEKIYINCYCPGWVQTAMTGWQGNITPDIAADTGVWAALMPDQPVTGKFFAERREISF